MMQDSERDNNPTNLKESSPDRIGHTQAGQRVRLTAYALLIVLTAGMLTGRILAVTAVDTSVVEKIRLRSAIDRQQEHLQSQGVRGAALEKAVQKYKEDKSKSLRLSRPFLSANDRSRWCTIRALVDNGTYAIDQIVTDPAEHARWQTIDMVKHANSGDPHLYSSKPTLLPTLLAGEYFLIQKLTGWTLADQPFQVVRTMLILTNVPAIVVILVLLSLIVETLGASDWGRLAVMAMASFGTFLTTFAVVLNNHLIAAMCVMVAFYAVVQIWVRGRRQTRWVMLAGLFSALAMAIDLPSGLMLAVLGIGLLFTMPRATLFAGLPMVLIVGTVAVGTNYLAHRTVLPPYAYRTTGQDWKQGNWYVYDYQVGSRVIASYWKNDANSLQNRSRIDRGEVNRKTYILHSLIGHHGLFSLTPMWLLSMAGVMAMLVRRVTPSLRALGLVIILASVGCASFYFSLGTEARNYGGMTSGPRWFFWLIPLWLVALIPATDWSALYRWRRNLVVVLLFFSVLSASYPTWNPWVQPWIHNAMMHFGWMQ